MLHFLETFFDFALFAFVVYDASCDHTLSWASWHFYRYLISAPLCQVNTVKNDILKLFDSIEKYGMCTFAFNLVKIKIPNNNFNLSKWTLIVCYYIKWFCCSLYHIPHPAILRWTYYLFFRWWNILFWWEICWWTWASGFSFHNFFCCSRGYSICCCNFWKNKCMWSVRATLYFFLFC